ncbi:type II toxin-antitoxin system HicB family antitoxin [Pasteurellaceae bacterium TAE3-ERU1]|nr:type II toxin-antitoxin system HicB family antitoxin [Pasteurellaceae bacterium TAE3-ERU1]
MKMMQYKNYVGTIEPDLDNGVLFGKLANIRDLVTYEATTLSQLKKEVEQSVEQYLADCKALGKTPDKPFKGVFNVRIGEELHCKAAMAAMRNGEQTLNAFVIEAIKDKVERVEHR